MRRSVLLLVISALLILLSLEVTLPAPWGLLFVVGSLCLGAFALGRDDARLFRALAKLSDELGPY